MFVAVICVSFMAVRICRRFCMLIKSEYLMHRQSPEPTFGNSGTAHPAVGPSLSPSPSSATGEEVPVHRGLHVDPTRAEAGWRDKPCDGDDDDGASGSLISDAKGDAASSTASVVAAQSSSSRVERLLMRDTQQLRENYSCFTHQLSRFMFYQMLRHILL